MDDKIKEVKLAILDRILANIIDKDKSLSADTIVAFAGIVEVFDKTEDFKKTPKSNPNAYLDYLIKKDEKFIEQPKNAEVKHEIEAL